VDIWGNADSCHLVSQKVTGNFELVARVASLQGVNDWSKAGLMVRSVSEPAARCLSVVISAAHGLAHQKRLQDNGATTSTKIDRLAAPHWLKVTRAGDTLTGFESKDGLAWTQTGVETFPKLPAAVYAGLAVSSHDNAAAATATFDKLQLTNQ
jgi:regulation of enolase protein 1 (concanavalin A-like superfamily)